MTDETEVIPVVVEAPPSDPAITFMAERLGAIEARLDETARRVAELPEEIIADIALATEALENFDEYDPPEKELEPKPEPEKEVTPEPAIAPPTRIRHWV